MKNKYVKFAIFTACLTAGTTACAAELAAHWNMDEAKINDGAWHHVDFTRRSGKNQLWVDSTWHQVGISRSNKTFRLWVDGVNVSSATSPAGQLRSIQMLPSAHCYC